MNAAILTGVVPSTGSAATQFSGGVHNLPRLLEDWGNGGSVTLTLNTSIVNLFASTRATNQWQTPGNYYYAPTRQFSFDPNFLVYAKLPPGTPLVWATTTTPSISAQPQNQTVTAGQPATFTVSVTGALPLSYQWRLNGTGLATATNATCTLTNAQPGDAGDYSVVVTNSYGATTSAVATLTVLVSPTILSQPEDQVILAGGSATFSVTAGGTPSLAYQWQYNGINLLEATSAVYAIQAVGEPTPELLRGGDQPGGQRDDFQRMLTVIVPPTLALQLSAGSPVLNGMAC